MINLLFSGNDGVFDGILTCLLSILKRSKNDCYRIYILTMDVSHIKENYVSIADKKIEFLRNIIQKYNPENQIYKIDVKSLYQEEFAGCPNEQAYCSPYTLLRLFADKIEELPDKILYLDVDILFNQDIHLLYDFNVEDVEYAAARDHYGKYLIHPNYINAGVLLLNMRKCKETNLFQRFNDQKFLHQHTVVRHFSKRLFYLPYPHTANIKQWHVSKVHSIFHYEQFDDVLYEYIYLKKLFENDWRD